MRYAVVIEQAENNYSAYVPDLPGCVATGTTVEHARQMIAEAIELHLDLMRQSGESLPAPSSSFEFAVDNNSAEELCTWVEIDDARQPVSN